MESGGSATRNRRNKKNAKKQPWIQTKPRVIRNNSGAISDPPDVLRTEVPGSSPAVAVFPRYSIHVIWLATLVTRIYVVSRKDAWIVHPDEVFQSTEIAHSLVYGYGFRPYEYLPPPDPNTTSAVERQEALTGMYSLRSFMVPRLYATVLYAAHKAAVNINPYHTCRLFHATVAAHLPVAVYTFTKEFLTPLLPSPTFTHPHDVSLLTALLVFTSQNFTVLGTHTLINSLLSPAVFLSLAYLVRRLGRLGAAKASSETTLAETDRRQSSPFADDSGISSEDSTLDNNNGDIFQTDEIIAGHGKSYAHGKHAKEADSPADSRGRTEFRTPRVDPRLVLTGVVFGALVYVRPDMVLLLTTVSISSLVTNVKSRRTLTPFVPLLCQVCCGVLAGVVAGGWEDSRSYGTWFLSPYQWFSFNVKSGMSSVLFGSKDFSFYARELFIRDLESRFCLGLVLAVLLFAVWRGRLSRLKDDAVILGAWLHISVPFVCLLAVYSLQKHKELRFIHDVLVFYYIMIAYSLSIMVHLLRHSSLRSVLVYGSVMMWVSASLVSIPSSESRTNIRWAYLYKWDSGDVNKCLEFVGNQADSTGVFLDRTIHITGGYSLLHKHIPVFTLVHFEFQEFGLIVHSRVPGDSWISPNRSVSVAKLNRVSNFVTSENSLLLLKYLIEQPEYNYFVVRNDREVIRVGYDEVFRSGTMRVLRRSFDEDAETQLQKVAQSIPLGDNSTILEYEGSWLHTFGLHEKAIERLAYIRRLGTPKPRVYQILALCHSALGDKSRAQTLYEECLRLHGSVCSKPQPKVVLHSSYNLDLNFDNV